MDVTTALLCDHAQVRDGLLFVLSGGVSRVMRESYPAPMGISLVLVVQLDRAEAHDRHELDIVVIGEDGEEVARMEAQLSVENTDAAKPAESIQMPLAVDLHAVVLSRPGAYEAHVYVDGAALRTLQFWAELVPGATQLM